MESYLQRLNININFPFAMTMAALIWARILSVIVVIPFLFGKPVPRTIRLGASVMLTAFLYPLLVEGQIPPQQFDFLYLLALFFKEILFGLSIGFAASMMFYGFEAAGRMIDNQRGVSLARILIPELGEQSSISGMFLFQFAVVIFLVLGGHRFFLKALAESYQVIPLLAFPESVSGLLPVIDLFGILTAKVLFISVQIAAPVIIAVLVADIILGVTNRFAPQINVWELGFNVRGYVGILILFLSLSFIARQVEFYTGESRKEVTEVIERMKAKPLPLPEPIEEISPDELEKPAPVVP